MTTSNKKEANFIGDVRVAIDGFSRRVLVSDSVYLSTDSLPWRLNLSLPHLSSRSWGRVADHLYAH